MATLALLGCDRAAPTDYRAKIFSVSGSFSGKARPLTGTPRVAIVWTRFADDPTQPPLYVGDDVDISSSFPNEYRIDITHLPPAGAIDPSSGLGSGNLVVYEDTNGNGRFDMTPADAPQIVDHLLGYPPGVVNGNTSQVLITFVPSAAVAKQYVGLNVGFNLQRVTLAGSKVQMDPLPLTSDIPIALVDGAAYDCFLMDPPPGYGLRGLADTHDGGPFGPFPLPLTPCANNMPPAGSFVSCDTWDPPHRGEFFATSNIVPKSPDLASLCGPLTLNCSGTYDTSAPPAFCARGK
jgi:hypothetical protein